MWEKLNKIQVQHLAAILIIGSCSVMAFTGFFVKPSAEAKEIIRSYFDLALFASCAFLFAASKKIT